MMKKTLISFLLVLMTTAAFISCAKDGAQGPEGPEGPQGTAGNANVTQYTFGTHNFATTASATLQVTTTADTMNRSAWFVYLVRASGNVYPIPGFGLNGSSDYRVYWSHNAGKVNFVISKISGTGEEYASIKIIRIYANMVTSGGRVMDPLPGIDFRDYHAVCDYYKLPY